MSALHSGSCIQVGEKNVLLGSELGRGGFGVVYKAIDQQSGSLFALKMIRCKDDQDRELVVREINSLIRARHENIVQLMGVDTCVTSSATIFFLLTEFCSGGDLNERLDRPSSYETEMQWLQQLSSAINYLHSSKPPIVHRDLKLENVLLADSEAENIKVADLGLAREYSTAETGSMNAQGTYYMATLCGTPYWMAPEVFQSHYTEKADIFSLGVIFYAILTRHFRQFGSKKIYGIFVDITDRGTLGLGMAMLTLKETLEVPFSSSFRGCDVMKSFIQAMLQEDHHLRPSVEEVQQTVSYARSSSSR